MIPCKWDFSEEPEIAVMISLDSNLVLGTFFRLLKQIMCTKLKR